MNRVEQMFAESSSPMEFAQKYFQYLAELMGKMDPKPVGQFIEAVEQARATKNQIFFLGNGGSAATASHFANDFVGGPRCWDNAYRALSLTDNSALVTAIGNDHGYDKIFELQLRALMREGDVVVGISASGNSPNVLAAMRYAAANGAVTVGLTGFDGGELAKISQINIHVPTAKGEYGPVEDLHMVIDHLTSGYLVQFNKQKNVVPLETPKRKRA
ncbi:MAG: SIS domain-containing protein [Bdellovibrionales bacterium]|nr:SIS domain-containing protein [Bdellovibrionales bacterium]